MACEKPYGLRRVFISREYGDTHTFYELRVSNIELPKIFAENVAVDESSGIRGDSAFVDGNINDLTGTITLTLPKSKADFINFHPIQTLFTCAGFSTATDSILPQNTGSCGNTFTLYTIDRTGLLAERLEGCIVTNIDFTFNRSDAPTVAFAFTASKKLEFWGSNSDQTALRSESSSIDIDCLNSGVIAYTGLNKSSTFEAGELPVQIIEGSTVESAYISALTVDAGSNYTITVTRANPVDHDEAMIKPAIPAGAVTLTRASGNMYCSNRGWDVLTDSGPISDLKIQSASLSIETGLSYGELIVGHDYKSEVLVGTLNATGNFTVYVETSAQAVYLSNINAIPDIVWNIQAGNYKIVMPCLVFTEPPDLALAKNEAASGDYNFKCYCGESSNALAFNLISLVSA